MTDEWKPSVQGSPQHIFGRNITGVGIGLQHALEGFQVFARMMPLPIFGVGKPDGRWVIAAGWTIIPNIRPQTGSLGSAFAGR